jgi:hypothetical protein
MKGIENKQILGIFMVIILIVIVVVFIMTDAFAWGKESEDTISFYKICLLWSLNKPAFSGTTVVDQQSGVEYDLSDPNQPWGCPLNIGVTSMPSNEDAPEWDSCRRRCMGTTG